MGKKKQPHYRIVATDSRAPRDGRFVENLGYYHPIHHPATLSVDLERVDYWVGRGAILSPTVRSLVSKAKAGGDEMVALVGAVTDADAGTDGAAANGAADKATAATEDASADKATAASAEAADAPATAEDSEAAEADAQAASADESGDASDGEAESAAAGDATAEAASAEEAAGETNAGAEPADESPASAEAEAAPDDGDA